MSTRTMPEIVHGAGAVKVLITGTVGVSIEPAAVPASKGPGHPIKVR